MPHVVGVEWLLVLLVVGPAIAAVGCAVHVLRLPDLPTGTRYGWVAVLLGVGWIPTFGFVVSAIYWAVVRGRRGHR